MSYLSSGSSQEVSHRQGVAFVLAAGALWSTVGLGIRLIEDASVWQILLYRSIALSVFLYAVINLRSSETPFSQLRRSGSPAIVAGLALVAAYSGGIYSIQVIPVANALLLFAAAPFITAVLGKIFLHEQVRSATWIAIIVAVTAIAIMVSGQTSYGAVGGSLAALGSAFGFSIFTIALRWGKSDEMLPAVFLSGLFAIIITLTICLALGLPLILSSRDGSISMAMGIFQVGAGLVLYTLGSRKLPAAELTLLSLAEVLLGPFWVWLFLGEDASIRTLIGGILLLAAIAGNAFSSPRRLPRY
ncbi:MAG: DMT family transporter [Amylibacter sp.]|jgi:DME family drug/metabolite transporter|tara:strand:- start:200 stop:1105 length:906 start_codon:yes stop_codon:yes gene_type:complete